MLPIFFKSPYLTIYSYPLFIGISWGVAFRFFCHEVDYFKLEISRLRVGLLFLGSFIASWFGAKGLFLIVNQEYMHIALSENFWLGGGFVFYGGAIAVFLFILIYSKFFNMFPVQFWPYIAPAAAMAHGIGRIGCALAGCCFGVECSLFGGKEGLWGGRVPIQLIESFSLLVLSFALFQMLKKGRNNLVLSFYAMSYAGLRFLLEFFRGDTARGIALSLSTSQWISLFVFMTVIGLILKCRFKKS